MYIRQNLSSLPASNGGYRLFRMSVFFSLTVLGLLLTNHAWAGLYKCIEDNGSVVYSDAPCRPPPPPKPTVKPTPAPVAPKATGSLSTAPAPAAAAINLAVAGKLNDALVTRITQHAMMLSQQYDYRSQCALAASDIKFSLTDHSSKPATVLSGGRREICDLQRESATTMQAAQLQNSVELGKINISINSADTQATAQFEAVTTLSMQGQIMMRVRCTRKDTLAVYQDLVLYKEVISTCKPI